MSSATGGGWVEVYRSIVLPAHCDHHGHVNVRYYAAFFDDAGWHMLALAGISRAELHRRGLGTVVARRAIAFHREITAGQLVVIKGAITRAGVKSFRHELRLYEADALSHCATQETVEVCFDTTARRAAQFPDEVRAKLAAVARTN